MPGEGEDISEVPVHSAEKKAELREEARKMYPNYPKTVKDQAALDEWARRKDVYCEVSR